MITEKQLIDKYLGWQYKHHGREEGWVDCWGLIIFIYKQCFNIELLDLESYEKNWALKKGNLFIENYYENWKTVTQPKYLDGILFQNSREIVYHAGVYLSNGRFIHGTKQGVIVGRLSVPGWGEQQEGIYRYSK